MTPAPRTAAIMQPTYLPYIGYFHLIAQSDVFVFLDDVQFERRSWQSRNRILTSSGELMLTAPVRKHSQQTPIREIELSDVEDWRGRHLASIRHAYAGLSGFDEGMTFLEETLTGAAFLADLHCDLIEAAARKARLQTQFVRASALGCGGKRSEHLLQICRAVDAETYLSPMGSADYIVEDGVFAAAGMPVRFQAFVPVEYPQGKAKTFTPYMAFIDAVMNVGWEGFADILKRMG